MGERFEEYRYSSFPIKMYIVEINWIINCDEDDYGFIFLEKLSRSKNLDFFDLDFFKIIIEYLYTSIKESILYLKLTFFLIRLVVYIWTMFYHESVVSERKQAQVTAEHHGNDDIYEMSLGSINLLLSLILLALLVFQTHYLGVSFWKNAWTILELVSGITNAVISAFIIFGSD